MCVKLRSNKMKPGDFFGFYTPGGRGGARWGMLDGTLYNARSEKLETLWSEYKRGVIFAESFWEADQEFHRVGDKDFTIGIIISPDMKFAVVTAPANHIVSPYHHRMPLILRDDLADKWINKEISRIPADKTFPETEFIIKTKAA